MRWLPVEETPVAASVYVVEVGVSVRFVDRTVGSVIDLLKGLADDDRGIVDSIEIGGRPPERWFRGAEDVRYGLVPTFHRGRVKVENEVYMMNVFKQNAREFVDRTPASEWEWMFLMRHHGLPSRLLDWTESPLIGLFFAVCLDSGGRAKRADGALWCLLPRTMNRWSLKWPEGNQELPVFTQDEAEFSRGENVALLSYLPSIMRGAGVRGLPPAAGLSVRATRRMQAQLGVFTIHHADKKPLELVGDGSHIWRYVIPRDRKEPIREELRRIGITRRTVFPDLDNVAAEAGEYGGKH